MTIGSGSAWPLAGTSAIARSILRPFGASWFSGTASVAHCASTASTRGTLSEHGLNVSAPKRRPPSAPACGPGACDCALQAASARAAVSGNRIFSMECLLGP
jgi:hypothetical protein